MRTRLMAVFLGPLIVILLVLGGAYAWSSARGLQQDFSRQQLDDLGYFLTESRQALQTGNAALVKDEMERYSELYGAQVAVVDHDGVLVASGGLPSAGVSEAVEARITLALSGRRAELEHALLPWVSGDSVLVDPVFDGGRVIGAVMVSESLEAPRAEIAVRWTLLAVSAVALIGLLAFATSRLANWVLRPMLRVDQAMAAIEQGEMHARIADDTGPSEMQRMIRIFNSMADEIERVVSRQQEFAMNASHELRNPLGALLLRVEYIATGLDESWEAEVEEVREEGRRMARILDTLLSIARSQRKDSSFAPVDLVELVDERLRAWREVSADRGVELALSGDASLVSTTDRTAVESAFDAVVDNALKFAPRGSTVDVVVRRADGQLRISVRDRGPGLEPEELERVLERFWRSPRDQNVPGSGLGLAIANDLLGALHGRLTVDSPPGGGLRVTLMLPEEEQ
ncbi:ATP-binding protein [Leucobacter sp. GX24907]